MVLVLISTDYDKSRHPSSRALYHHEPFINLWHFWPNDLVLAQFGPIFNGYYPAPLPIKSENFTIAVHVIVFQ